MKTQKILMTAAVGGLMALPFAMPSTAQADDFKISLNLGGAPYYSAPQRVIYREAPQRVVYVKEPRRVVYHSRPIYRERVVYREYREHGRGHGRGHGHNRWDDRGNRMAWR